MPYTSNTFAVSQNVSSPNKVLITDTSEGSDDTVDTRRLYILDYTNTSVINATTLGDGYILWPLTDAVIEPALKPKDWAVRILIVYVDASGNALYSADGFFSLDLNSRSGFYSVTQKQVAAPDILQDANYFTNLQQLDVSIQGAKNAVEVGADLYKAQMFLDYAKFLLDRQNVNF